MEEYKLFSNKKIIMRFFLTSVFVLLLLILIRTTGFSLDGLGDEAMNDASSFNPAVGFFVAIFTLFLNYVYDHVKLSNVESRKSAVSDLIPGERYSVQTESVEQEENIQGNTENDAKENPQIESKVLGNEDVEKEYEAIVDKKRDGNTQEDLPNQEQGAFNDPDIAELEDDLYDEDLLELENRLMGEQDELDEETEEPLEHERVDEDYLLSKDEMEGDWKEKEEFEQKLNYTKSLLNISDGDDVNTHNGNLEETVDLHEQDIQEDQDEFNFDYDDSFVDDKMGEENVVQEKEEKSQESISDYDNIEDFDELLEDEIDDFDELDELDTQINGEKKTNEETANVEDDFTEQELNRLYDEIKEGNIFEEDDEDELEVDDDVYDDKLYQEILREYKDDSQEALKEEDSLKLDAIEAKDTEGSIQRQQEDLFNENQEAEIILQAKEASGEGTLYENKKEGKVVKVLESEAGQIVFKNIQAKAAIYRLTVFYSALIWSTIDLSINGGELMTLDILGEGDIDELKHSSLDIELDEGNNIIKLENNSYQNVLVEKIELTKK